MPSTTQSGTNSGEYETNQEAFIAADMDIMPLLRGIQSRQQAQAWLSAMNQAEESFRDEYYEVVEEKLRECGELRDGVE